MTASKNALVLAKNTFFIFLALFIDGLQAVISWGIAAIAAFPVSAGGTTLGCVAGNQVAGQIGCWAGGLVVGLLSATPLGLGANAAVATYTVPVGIAVGMAVNMSISMVIGWGFLVPLMVLFNANVSWGRLVWGGGEMIPGVNNVPFWTLFVIVSLWQGATTKKARRGILGLAGAALLPARGIVRTKADTAANTTRGARGWTPLQEEFITEPETGTDLVRAATTRTALQDIRPFDPEAHAARTAPMRPSF